MFQENSQKNHNVTSSTANGFYPSIRNQSQSESFPGIFSNKFPMICQTIQCLSQKIHLENINKQIQQLQKQVDSNSYQLEKMAEMEEIYKLIQFTDQEIKNIKSNNQQIHHSIKQQFLENVSKIQKQLNQIQNSWKLLKQKSISEMNIAVQQVKNQQKNNQNILNKQIKIYQSNIRDKLQNLGKEIKLLKKQRENQKGKIFQQLEFMRNKYLTLLKKQEKRRLEQETCSRTEKAFRRSIF